VASGLTSAQTRVWAGACYGRELPSRSGTVIGMTTLRTRAAESGETDWRDDAACRGLDPELFFPVGTAGPALLQIGRAKQVCAGCPVRAPCLDWALATGQDAGVWGGTSEDERRALRRARPMITPRR